MKAVNSLCISPDKNCLISISAFSYYNISTHPFTNELLENDFKVIVWSIALGEKLFKA